jgi:hypothetical protein
MNIYELNMWMEFYEETPFGDYVKDLREALNCAILLAPHVDKNIPPEDLMLFPRTGPNAEQDKIATLRAKCEGFFGSLD